MKPEDQIKAIQAWQNNPLIHPITCGNSSNHGLLFAEKSANGPIILRCPDCRYTQYHIPVSVLQAYRQEGFHQNDRCSISNCQKAVTRNTCQIWVSGGRIMPVCKECAKKKITIRNKSKFQYGLQIKGGLV